MKAREGQYNINHNSAWTFQRSLTSKLYKEQEDKVNAYQEAKKAYEEAKYSLDYKIKQKATGDREHSVKYNNIYGMPNYTSAMLERDITETLSTSYKPLTKEEIQQKKEMVREEAKNNISEPKQLKISFEGQTF